MRFKWFVPPILAVGLFAAALPVFSQVVPAYKASGIPWTVGAGPSSWDVDWGHGRMIGVTAWADWYPERVRSWTHIRGLGAEFEFRDVSWAQNLPPQKNQRQFNYLAGPIFNWHLTDRFHPILKTDLGYGVVDFYPLPGSRVTAARSSLPAVGSNIASWVHSQCAATTNTKSGWESSSAIRSTRRASRPAYPTISRIRKDADGTCSSFTGRGPHVQPSRGRISAPGSLPALVADRALGYIRVLVWRRYEISGQDFGFCLGNHRARARFCSAKRSIEKESQKFPVSSNADTRGFIC